MEIKLWLPNPWEFERYYNLPVNNTDVVDGIYLISEMKNICVDFGPFKRTIEELLKSTIRAEEDQDKKNKEIDEQCHFFAEHLGMVYQEDGIQQIIGITKLTEAIKSELKALVDGWRCSEEEIQTIHQQLMKYITADSIYIKEYEKSGNKRTLKAIAEDVSISFWGDGQIERYFLDKEYLDIEWMKVGNHRIMNMEEVWILFSEKLKEIEVSN